MHNQVKSRTRQTFGWMIVLSLLMVILTACQPEVAPTPTSDGTLTRPDLVGLIEWDRSPSTVVFRATQTGGDANDFLNLGDIPDCTIYGDNSMVYLLPTTDTTLVAVDKVPDEAIRTFVEDLTLNYQLFNQGSGTEEIPAELLPPVYDSVSISINGQSFAFDSLGGWVAGYYERVVERCRAVSLTPAEFAPEAGVWVTVRSINYDTNQPALLWDNISTGIDLTTMADKERQWIRGAGAVALWDILRANGADIQIQQGDGTYQVALQIPGITLNAPAAP